MSTHAAPKSLLPLPRDFYLPSADVVAPLLLGHYLLRCIDGELCGGLIAETEAYVSDDPSCHAYVRETVRNRSMWGQEGRAYVYLIYGMHCCVNAVCRPKGVAEAVLIRAIEPTFGLEIMQLNRATTKARDLTNGPAKFCAALDITRAQDGVDLCDSDSPLWIARNLEAATVRETCGPIVTTTRIGITRAADWPLRFYLDQSDFVSRRVAKDEVAKAEGAKAEGAKAEKVTRIL